MKQHRAILARGYRASKPEMYKRHERTRYRKDLEKRRAGQAKWRRENPQLAYEIARRTSARIDVIKAANPCPDCHSKYPPECMDFDHRPGETKLAGVGQMAVKRMAWWKIEAEIAKCDIVCANCHRIRTKERHRQIRMGRVV